MKRKIKALGVLLSNFYKSHEKIVDKIIFLSFAIIGAICLAIIAYKEFEPREVTKAEIEYCEEKVEEIINSDLKSIPRKTIKEMRKEGFIVDLDVENRKITIGFKEETTGKIIFSYSEKKLSKEISYSSAKSDQIWITVTMALVGSVAGMIVLLIIVIAIIAIMMIHYYIKYFFTEFIPRIKDKYKDALKEVDLQDKNDKELTSESIEQKEMQGIEEKD